MRYRTKDFDRTTNAFNYLFEDTIEAGETVFLKMPVVSANKRGINDIGWQCDGDNVEIYGTLAHHPETTEFWSDIKENYLVNKTVSALKIVNNGGEPCRIIIRVILN